MIGRPLNSPMVRFVFIIAPGGLNRSYNTAEPIKGDRTDMAIDPICGMRVDEASVLRAEREGQTFYFLQ